MVCKSLDLGHPIHQFLIVKSHADTWIFPRHDVAIPTPIRGSPHAQMVPLDMDSPRVMSILHMGAQVTFWMQYIYMLGTTIECASAGPAPIFRLRFTATRLYLGAACPGDDCGGGTNPCDVGLDLSGSWQQGHSATYNAPSRI